MKQDTPRRGIRASTHHRDPQLLDIDDEFRALLLAMQRVWKLSGIGKKRLFHSEGIAARGSLEVLADVPGLPELFRPGRRWPLIVRYSNETAADDVCPDSRGVALRLLDPSGAIDLTRSLFDLTLVTGECSPLPHAEAFARYLSGGPEAHAALAGEFPQAVAHAWDMLRLATSFASYAYHSQLAYAITCASGVRAWVRFRLVPDNCPPPLDAYIPDDPARLHNPMQPLPRPPGDTRPPTFLRDELRDRLLAGGIDARLQIQYRERDAGTADENVLDSSLPWPVTSFPWRDLARVRVHALLEKADAEGIAFDPCLLPPGMGLPLARSPRSTASLGHLRALAYRLAAAARRGEALPPEIAALLPPPESPQAPRPQVEVSEPRRTTPQTVCIVGAGATGLTLALELERNGHRAVVVEADASVAGKCASIVHDGRAYDLGGHVCTPEYEQTARLIAEMQAETEPVVGDWRLDSETGGTHRPSQAFFQPDVFRRFAAARASEFPRLHEPGLAHSARALAEPALSWLARHRLDALAEAVGAGYTAAGYGYLDDRLPALYFLKYAEMSGLFSTRRERLGHRGIFTVRGGFQQFWRRVAARLGDVRCGAHVLTVERHADGVRVITEAGTIEADALVLTTALDQALPLLADVSPEERAIASRVRHVPYYTTVCTVSGWPGRGFHFVRAQGAPPPPGHCVAFQRRYADSDVFTCYSYGADGRDDEAILEQLYRDAARWGGRVEDVLAHRRWSFLPHFEAADLRDGILERLEDLQGRRRTYYAGSLAAFELIECNVAYARALATRAFAPPLPRASMVEVSAQAPSPVVLGPGHHFEMLAEPHVHAVARAVRDAFEVTCRS